MNSNLENFIYSKEELSLPPNELKIWKLLKAASKGRIEVQNGASILRQPMCADLTRVLGIYCKPKDAEHCDLHMALQSLRRKKLISYQTVFTTQGWKFVLAYHPLLRNSLKENKEMLLV